jgi:ADP-ribosylglycohydrolase
LRWWLLGCPAGIGFATLRAILKLWFGWPPARSGVFSAGNGPAMRSAILGAAVADRERLRALVRASTRITHTDPKAEYGALAVALAARLVTEQPEVTVAGYVEQLRVFLPAEAGAFLGWVDRVAASVTAGEATAAFAASQGMSRGVSGYVYHSVPVALHAWLSHPRDYSAAVQGVILAGGDSDSTAAITGGIVGTAVGLDGIPAEWVNGLAEWPRTVAWMKGLAEALARGDTKPPRLSGLLTLPRNGWFFLVVVAHVLRRLLPPY